MLVQKEKKKMLIRYSKQLINIKKSSKYMIDWHKAFN